MKGLLFIGSVLLAQLLSLTVADPAGDCPSLNGDLDVLLPDNEDCHFFYKCDWGKPILQECPGGLVFNYKINVCDYPYSAECYSDAIEAPDSGENGSENGGGSDEEDGGDEGEDGNGNSGESWGELCQGTDRFYPDPEDCSSFYLCNQGTPVHMHCPDGTYYDAATFLCDASSNVKCTEVPSIIDPEPVDPDEGNGGDGGNNGGNEGSDEYYDNLCTGNQMYYPDPEDCQSFYMCDNQKANHMVCPEGTLYNAALYICDHPSNVRCSEVPSIVEPEPVDPDGNGSGEGGSHGGDGGNGGEDEVIDWEESLCSGPQSYYPDPEDCQSFYQCDNQKATHITCPDGTLYNAALYVCDHPSNVRCSEIPSIVDPEPVDPDGNDSGEGEGGDGGNGGEDETIDWEENLCSGPQSYYPDPEDCQSFYQCDNHEAMHITCPEGTLYNAALYVCDHPSNVRCSEVPSIVDPEPVNPDGNDSGEGAGGDGGNGGDDETIDWEESLCSGPQLYYPDPEDCQSFYQCDNHEAMRITCPEGTLYNAALYVCDHPSNVRCAESPGIIDPEPMA